MIHALRLPVVPALPLGDMLRGAIVLACAIALIMAGRAFPF